MVEKGASEKELFERDFYTMCRYGKGVLQYRLIVQPTRKPPRVEVLVGSTGVGKSRFVHERGRIFEQEVFVYPGKGWFDGYDGQRIVLFEEYRGDMPIELLLQVLDRYPLRVPVKGGFRGWNPRNIYITTNTDPRFWYKDVDDETLRALFRRFHQVHRILESIY